MQFNPFTMAPAFMGRCMQSDVTDGDECKETEVVEISVSQSDNPKEVLGTLCRKHADAWYSSHVTIKEI